MAQSSFSGTSLWLLLVGGPTLLFTHCLPCWFDNLSLWPPPLLSKQETLSPLCLALHLICPMKSSKNAELQSPVCFFLPLSLPAVFSPVSKEHKEILSINFGLYIKDLLVTLTHLKCIRIIHSGESHHAYRCCLK